MELKSYRCDRCGEIFFLDQDLLPRSLIERGEKEREDLRHDLCVDCASVYDYYMINVKAFNDLADQIANEMEKERERVAKELEKSKERAVVRE